ncbi:Predicted arabinose efflux permease, MFS family [Fontibacillus panacisegetis]|uniref:Predicted arabinose efflux permease, MFS family n=1 Tax=Fontibacillus panacisegetis TaxID=670482 RepID=A0A1G7JRZ6_9BACL|nr:MFS transporter [Fontibacillus panacisegetis]SDF27710.1 Predicted arabinose efflux permease, MFS family [Fontibacillus panacisegetis]
MKKRSYYGLLVTIALSGFGDAFGLLAMEWLVYELTGSKLAMGALALCSGVPELVLRLLGSPLADRLPRERLMAGLACMRLIAIVLPLAAGLTGQLQLWHLFLAAGLSGSCAALFMPTAMAFIPSIADSKKLVRAFAIIDGCRNAVALIGPAIAGAITAASGALPALGINAACYIVSIFTLLYLPKTHGQVKKSADFSISAYVRDIFEAFSFYRQFPAMLTIMCMVSISNMSSIAIWTMMVPFVREVLHLNAAALGTLTTASALGTLTGLAIISLLGEIKRRRIVMLCSLAAMGFFNSILGLVHSFPVALVVLFAAGAAGPFFGSLSSTLHGKLVPDHLQGRVNSIRFLIGGGLQPVGALAGGAIAQLYGVPVLILIAGLLPLISSVAAALFLSSLKALDGNLQNLEVNIHL